MLPLIPCCNAESIYRHARTPLKAPISPLVLSLFVLLSSGAVAQPQQGLAMHGAPAEADGFTHFPYVNPDAPKGGRVIFGVQGSFDSLNPLIVKGNPAEGLRDYLYESLLARANDEAFTLYGLIAESVETPDDRSSVEFTLRPEAKFSDGTPITVDDVIFSLGLLRDHGRPNHRSYYKKVTSVEQTGERKVKFTFDSSGDREMPLIIGLMTILPKHRIDPEQFEKTTLVPPIGSGPYTLAVVDPGKSVTYRRDKNYWGRDLPINRGLWNFDTIRYDYYRDGNTHFEAFKKGLYDVRAETDPGRWQTAYTFPALRDGHVVKEEFPYGLPKGMQGLVFNTRRAMFTDMRVREALLHLFDFEWIDHTYYFDLYKRTASYFDGCELSAHGVPASARERELLAPFPGVVRDDIMEGKWMPPKTDGSGRDREGLRRAFELFKDAGYELKGRQLVHGQTGKPFGFEILTTTRDQERLCLAYAQSLKRAGITALVRNVDGTQFQHRLLSYDFDMTQYHWEQSLSPGNEQLFYWSSEAADQQGSRNYMGVKSKAVDAMIAALLAATRNEDFIAAVRALDRVLLSGFYVIPLYYPPVQWIARWTRIKHPNRTSLFGYLPETWWHQDARS